MMGARGHGAGGSGPSLRFEYFFENAGQPVTPEHPAWLRPLPLSRQALGEPASYCEPPGASISVGGYFRAVSSFLEGPGWSAIVRLLAQQGADTSAAESFRIFLSKHGEFYHPARVEAQIRGKPFPWVVNVALSAAGTALLPKEQAILERLKRDFPVSYVPEVHAAGAADTGDGRMAAMFLGQWFSGHHEFHLSRRTPDGRQALVVWDAENGHRYLDAGQARAVYYEIARILTHYFNLRTFECIGAWHHAAGDFVVRPDEAHPGVRLITVREYRPFLRARTEGGAGAPDIKTLLEALLIFLLSLGIRTRLDRLDGVGEMAWAEPAAVEATLAGMLAALGQKQPPFELPLPLDEIFRRYLAACSQDDLLEMCGGIGAKAFPPGSPERDLVERHLAAHAASLGDALARI